MTWLAAEKGYVSVMCWVRANGCKWDLLTCMGAAEGGHLEVLQWVRANSCEWDRAQVNLC